MLMYVLGSSCIPPDTHSRHFSLSHTPVLQTVTLRPLLRSIRLVVLPIAPSVLCERQHHEPEDQADQLQQFSAEQQREAGEPRDSWGLQRDVTELQPSVRGFQQSPGPLPVLPLRQQEPAGATQPGD